MANAKLINLLIKHEGLMLKPYLDSVGKLTIGVGRNLDDVGITKQEAMVLLADDLERVAQEAVDNFAWFKSISVTRQDVVMSMLFNMGLSRFKGFVKMIDALKNGNFEKAASEMLASRWATQVWSRSQDLAFMMREGIYPSA